MSLSQELTSWGSLSHVPTATPPKPADQAPSSLELKLPCEDGKPAVVVFLRHCGCPFAEKTFHSMRSAAAIHPNIHFLAISHSTAEHTSKWLSAIGGVSPDTGLSLITDSDRKLYASWGLGASSLWHVLSPWSMWDVFKLAKDEDIVNRPTESGSRWQQSGAWAVDRTGKVASGGPAGQASEIPDFEALVRSVEA